MLEPGHDQASGLRRFMSRRTAQILPVAGSGEHPGYVVRLAQSLCDTGLRVALVTDFDQELEQAMQGRPRKGFVALHAIEIGHGLSALTTLSEQCDITLVAVDDARLARGLSLPAHEAVVVSGSGPEAIATSYARIKALVGLGSIREVCTLFDRVSAGEAARSGHRRLAQATSKFLGVDLAFVGAAPEPWGPGGYRPLAEALADWTRYRIPRTPACLPH